jgi:Spherulation-specific family 4
MTCEEPYQKYKGHEVQKRLKEYYYDQSRSGYMISGTPREEISSAVRELRHRGAYVFVTDLVDDIYESFGPSWTEFITAMDKPQDSI